MLDVGLVLEGGGMRGLYTAGVLEFFMEKDLYFPYVIGVSAGACMAASYLSRQKGRNKKVNIDLVSDPRYLSFRNLLRQREIFGMDFLFDEVPNRIVPFDFDTFKNGSEEFLVGTTDCQTGEPIYFNKREHGENMHKIIRASSSVPFISSCVHYEDKQLLDGGIADPIPIKKSQNDGMDKNIVVLTKRAKSKKQPKISTLIKYKDHPKIQEVLQIRHHIYNQTISYLYSEEKKDHVFLIQPSMDLPVSAIERNQIKLYQLYILGYMDAKRQYKEILQFGDRQHI
ncbi:patatin-like phospholipase family protein [Bacillus sp. AK128]